ncbi:MAG: MOSC domain-containing protein [Planctomycetota bacterium]|nr:sulfurase [Planctomycetota bacterium]MEE2712558.1 MOSC domain-containing protein [Planctomycetota bacterium]
MGQLDKIWVKRTKHGPMDGREAVDLVVGEGVVGNADTGGRRQVTVLDAARWAEACGRLGRDVDPSSRRANFLVSGVDLEGTTGRRLAIGSCVVLVNGETVPCEPLDASVPGIKAALQQDWAGGVYGQVVVGGAIAVGDPVAFETG